MKTIFLLSGEHTDIAKAEVEALFGRTKSISERVLIHDIAKPIAKAKTKMSFTQLAYTKSVSQVLFKTTAKNLIKKINSYPWNKVYKKNFCVRINNISQKPVPKEFEMADLIWKKLKNPVTQLTGPETLIQFIFVNNEVYCGKTIFINEEQFHKRQPHMRPEFSPISLNPKLARAMVNLTGIKDKKDVLIDPFCGTAGILLEASIMGFRSIGYDIDENCLRKAKTNLEHFGIKNFSLKMLDSTKKWPDKAKYIVADLPYGKSAKLSDEKTKLYREFLENLKRMKIKRAVISFPTSYDYIPLIKKSKLKVKNQFDYYIHKSMTKKILVLSA
ncbi:MAG: methyltransferase domain-containing protein [Nanoarchaeota archaeon]|nr:methyltransferase domain-containing protein [Nanoarchaeota archaeon]